MVKQEDLHEILGDRPAFLEEVKKIGGIVEFGHYEQDNDLDNGPEPIEWIVLDVQAGKSLLISKYALDCMPYNEMSVDVTWKQCSIRQWLYKDFPNAAFTDLEQSVMLVTDVENGQMQGNNKWNTSGGINTHDRLFLLSYAEANKYFDSDNARRCEPTVYTKSHMNYTDQRDYCWWWLRSPGIDLSNAAITLLDGSLGDSIGVNNEHTTVRPAFWISHEKYQESLGYEAVERLQALKKLSQEKWSELIGSVVTFGHYEQDNDLENGSEPIEWIVLDVQDGAPLLISRYALDSKLYNETRASVTWESSSLRKWLNGDFIQAAFEPAETALLMTTMVDNATEQGNSLWSTLGGKNSRDQVFLLSYAEAGEFFNSKEGRCCLASAYAKAQGVYTTANGNCWWWLRSPGLDQSNAAYVNTDGSLGGSNVYSGSGAVRPAFRLNLKLEPFK